MHAQGLLKYKPTNAGIRCPRPVKWAKQVAAKYAARDAFWGDEFIGDDIEFSDSSDEDEDVGAEVDTDSEDDVIASAGDGETWLDTQADQFMRTIQRNNASLDHRLQMLQAASNALYTPARTYVPPNPNPWVSTKTTMTKSTQTDNIIVRQSNPQYAANGPEFCESSTNALAFNAPRPPPPQQPIFTTMIALIDYLDAKDHNAQMRTDAAEQRYLLTMEEIRAERAEQRRERRQWAREWQAQMDEFNNWQAREMDEVRELRTGKRARWMR
ncbi:hypothetical protein BJ741DRAFT_145897 [Chytriomyces cf. hyalinus JEL632]|nr:hypothetical protein BJ741DRAFT_145897 [Chytriomyces cf. hyalinus JEL632]